MAEETSGSQSNSTVQDAPQELDLDPGMLIARLDSWLDTGVRMLPNMVIALIAAVLVWFIARAIGRTINRRLAANDRDNLGEMLGGLVRWALVLIGGLLAATIVFPTLQPADLIAGLGVGSVAIGFAFKDILQNWLAGLLILLRQPFEIGDQIEVNGREGTVEHIKSRATLIRTYDGKRAVVPNSEIYTSSVEVMTAHDVRRTQYDVGIGYADDMDDACEAIIEAMRSVKGVEIDPEPQAFPWDLAASWVTIRARWWTSVARASVVRNRAEVIRAIKLALDERHIDMPYETKVQLMHDQSEASDGDRSAQREGWPNEGNGTTPRWKAQKDAANATAGNGNKAQGDGESREGS